MEPTDNRNIDAVKRFIEAQIRPGEKYDYETINRRLEVFFSRDINKPIRKYLPILERVNFFYRQMITGEQYNPPNWLIYKLKQFCSVYRCHKVKPIQLPHFQIGASGLTHVEIHVTGGTADSTRIDSKHYNRRIAGVPMRGHYYQEAPTDENGCVVVCNNDE